MTLLTFLVNIGLSFAMDKLTESERHTSKTNHYASLIIKNAFAQFLNTAVIYYIISLLHPEIDPLTENGIVVKIMSLVAANGFIEVFWNMMSPKWIVSNCQSSRKKKHTAKMFQINLNKAL